MTGVPIPTYWSRRRRGEGGTRGAVMPRRGLVEAAVGGGGGAGRAGSGRAPARSAGISGAGPLGNALAHPTRSAGWDRLSEVKNSIIPEIRPLSPDIMAADLAHPGARRTFWKVESQSFPSS